MKSKNKLYILEGADGTGKTTLSRAIIDKVGGHILHGTYNTEWNMRDYHENILSAAGRLLLHQTVVMDRWAISELIYGTVFRGEPQYKVLDMIDSHKDELDNATWIYCRHEDVVKNHERNKEIRVEMFDDMEKVQAMYDGFVRADKQRDWNVYDFGKVALSSFVDLIIKE